MESPSISTISQDIVKGRQSWEYTHILKLNDLRLSIHIDVDAHKFQSHATICVWDKANLKWNHIADIPYQSMKSTELNVYAQSRASIKDFIQDEENLLNKAKQIIL